jgi:hypothetical protein
MHSGKRWVLAAILVLGFLGGACDNAFESLGDKKKVYLGGEFSFKKFLSLRAGLYQGYLTAGATLDLWILHLSYATYAAEVGMFPGQVSDRRHTAQLAFEF